MQKLLILTGIYLITRCVVIAKVHKQSNNVVGTDSPLLEGERKPLNVLEYHVSLRMKSLESVKFGNGHFCSGVMITSNFVLTVAHCLQNVRKNEIMIVKGNVALNKKDNETVIYRVRKIFIHENYKKKMKLYDIALLELRSKDVRKVNSKVSLANTDETWNDIECQTSGWGDATKGHEISDTLKTSSVKLIKSEVCNVTEPFTGKVQDGMICAGVSNVCTGDSGGCLICHNTLVGLVSWGPEKCGKDNLPTVYTNVGFYHEWINSKMASLRKRAGAGCDGLDDYLDDSSEREESQLFLLHLNLFMIKLYFNTFR